ncbi:MAG: ankyrin repeat domain-containing protein [bacterium]
MVKKYIFLFYLCSIFLTGFSVNAMKLFVTKKRMRDLSEYHLPNEKTLKHLGVEQCWEIAAGNQVLLDLYDYDQDALDAFNSLFELKRSENSLDSGNGARLSFIFESESALRQFISKIHEIAKGLRTTILHILVELKCVNNLEPSVKFLEKNKGEFDFNNIDACPQQNLTYPAHKNLTPLFYAVLLNDFGKTKTLIEQGASIYVRNKFGYSLLHMAIFHKNPKIVKLILDKFKKDKEEGEEIFFDILNDKRNVTWHSPLHFAVWRGDISVIAILLDEKNLQINAQDKGNQTPFHILAHNYLKFPEYRTNAEAIAKMLIAKKGNPRITDKNGCKPIYYLDRKEMDVQLRTTLFDGERKFISFWFG